MAVADHGVLVQDVVYAGLNFGRFDDPAFGVIWLYWAVLWGLFFLVLGLKREELTRFTGAIAVVAGVITCAVPAFMLLVGVWAPNTRTAAIVLAALCVLSLGLYGPLRQPRATPATAPAPELREGESPQQVAAAGAAAPSTRMHGNVAATDERTARGTTDVPTDRRR